MSRTIRTLLVDDELPALELLRELLSAHPQIEIVGQARNVTEAATLAATLTPDLIFLDIQMPREDGFALLPQLPQPTSIIFVTAHNEHAVRAFTVNAVDYLLKPVHPDRLRQSLARLGKETTPTVQGSVTLEDNVFFKTDRGLQVAKMKAITYIESEENYTRVHLHDGRNYLLRRTMAEWEALLPSQKFPRLERCLIVGLHAIRDLQVQSREKALLYLTGSEQPINLARRASFRLRQLLEEQT